MKDEPCSPEYRVTFKFGEDSDEESVFDMSGPVKEDDKEIVLRVESERNLVVYSVMFIRTSVLENQELMYKETSKIFKK